MNNRKFIPYKGWCVVNENGEIEADPFMATKEGPLQIVNDIEKHMLSNKYADRHITYNLLDKEGKEILTKWVRKIKYNPLGFYLLEDNNEDDQIENYRYIKTDEYWEKYNIVTNEGALLSENWFDCISSSITNGYFHVVRGFKQNLIDMTGRYLLKSDAKYVSYFNGLFAYCYRDGVLNKVFEGGTEVEYKQLETAMLGDISINGNDTVSIAWQNEEPRMMNLVLMNKHLLFKQWYDKVLFSGIRGLYFVIKNGNTKLVDLGENPVTDYEFELPCSPYFFNNQVVIRIEDEYAILNHTGKVEHKEGFTSVLCPGRMGLWEMDMCTRGKHKHFYHGQGGEFIGYAHEFLLNRGIIGLFEKNKVWYYPDGENNMVKLFEWDPSEIDNTSN